MKLIGILQQEGLVFYYKKQNQWQRVRHFIVDLNDSFKRTPFPRNLRAELRKSRVVIFGVGSGGSRLALGLARSGIEKIKLVDPDEFSIENLSRHECDLLDIGRFKVYAVKEKIFRINPSANVATYPFDIFKKRETIKESVFSNVDLIIGATDKTSVQLKINYECFNRKIPALFAGCYDEARGGEVLYVLPGETSVCLECLRGGVRQPEKKGNIDYSTAQGPEDYKGEPGLNAAINLITDVAQQYAVALLLRKEKCEIAKLIDPKKPLVLIGGALGEGYYLFKKPFHFMTPVLKGPWKDCGVCHNTDIGRTVKETIKKQSFEAV